MRFTMPTNEIEQQISNSIKSEDALVKEMAQDLDMSEDEAHDFVMNVGSVSDMMLQRVCDEITKEKQKV